MKIWKITCSLCKHERFIYLKVTNDLNGARKLQQLYKCKIVVIFIKEVDIYNLKLSKLLLQKQPLKGVLEKRCSENMQQIYRRTPMPKCNFNKAAKQLYWYRTSAWVFSSKFPAYFLNIFSWEHFWVAASAALWSFWAGIVSISLRYKIVNY